MEYKAIKPLPCPFCGGEAKRSIETFEHTILSWVYCTNCGAAGGYRNTEAEAIAAWNTRAQTVFGMTLDEVRQMMKRDAERTRNR